MSGWARGFSGFRRWGFVFRCDGAGGLEESNWLYQIAVARGA